MCCTRSLHHDRRGIAVDIVLHSRHRNTRGWLNTVLSETPPHKPHTGGGPIIESPGQEDAEGLYGVRGEHLLVEGRLWWYAANGGAAWYGGAAGTTVYR